MPTLTPLALKDASSLIERVFPAQKISAEAQKERKAGAGQTLTALGSYWKGRKPLIMVRAIVLGCLLPVTDDLEADLHIFELLMAIDDAAFGRREPNLKVAEIAERITLTNPWDFFDFTNPQNIYDADEIEALQFPLDLSQYPKLKLRWQRGLAEEQKHPLLAQALVGLSYEEKVGLCKRPEELDPAVLYGSIWDDVNAHLAEFGIEADSHEQLVEQLGILRYGHRPRVGDTFCGGGSIPFEAARLGCDVYASDLNPIACMLTWGALNIIGASPEKRAEIEKAQRIVIEAVDQKITALGIEHNAKGDRARVFLYCLETRCPETGWLIPLLPTLVVSTRSNVMAVLEANYQHNRFDIKIISNVSDAEMKMAVNGTVQDGSLVYELEGKVYRTSIKTIRGDYRTEEGENRNCLRQWDLNDFKPRCDDIFQERLYCIQWITKESLALTKQETYFASVSEEDLERENKVEQIIEENLTDWQISGLIPDMEIEPGAKTDEPIRTRGWRYWHQLFSPRQLLMGAMALQHSTSLGSYLLFSRILDFNSKLTIWVGPSNRDKNNNTFSQQKLSTLLNRGERGWLFLREIVEYRGSCFPLELRNSQIDCINACSLETQASIWITDPPYADAVRYEEITEYFIAWLRKNPPAPFDQWTWDSRRALAIKGDGEDFRRGMVDAYRAMANHMPDNGLQCVMFTHQDTGVWADMVSIFWAAGLRVVSAWYIATETTSELKQGGYVQGTVTLLLRKRLETASTFKQRLLPKIRKEVTAQIESMMHLNDEAQEHGETVFNDSDLQMAGYAAALKVLTQYTEVDGRDMTSLALQPRQKGESTVVDDIVEYASEVANNLLIPERLKELNPDTWSEITGVERFYLRMIAIEQTGAAKLDNYQNFSKAFHVEYQPLMASLKPNEARLKGAKQFKPRELTSGDLGGTLLSELLMAIQELLNDKDPKVVIGQIRTSLDDLYFQKRPHLMAIAQYLYQMWRDTRPEEAQKAEIIANRIRNEGI